MDAARYGNDLKKLKGIIDELYKSSPSKPSLLAPGGFFSEDWFTRLLQVTGPGVLNALTHHIYNLGAGNLCSMYFFHAALRFDYVKISLLSHKLSELLFYKEKYV